MLFYFISVCLLPPSSRPSPPPAAPRGFVHVRFFFPRSRPWFSFRRFLIGARKYLWRCYPLSEIEKLHHARTSARRSRGTIFMIISVQLNVRIFRRRTAGLARGLGATLPPSAGRGEIGRNRVNAGFRLTGSLTESPSKRPRQRVQLSAETRFTVSGIFFH